MKKLLILLLILVTTGSILASCGESQNSSSEHSSKLPVSSTAVPTSSSKTPTSSTTPPTVSSTQNADPIKPTQAVVYNVIPDFLWGYSTKDNATTFTMGNGVYAFKFSSVNISEMKYLEFDLYLPSITNFANITNDTQFEITSSQTCDKEEFAWTGHTGEKSIFKDQTITKGWNHIKITLPEMPDVNLASVNYIRWYWVSPQSTIKNCKVANLRFTSDVSVDPVSIDRTTTAGFIVDTVYPTSDLVIAMVDITKAPYNADNTGKTDVTAILNRALSDVYNAGGGTVFMPIGQYLVTGSVTIPAYCTLRGDWQDPDVGVDYGTIILAKVKADAPVNEALFMIGGSAGVNGLTVYYPEQSLENVKAYPFTFYSTGKGESYMLPSITNCTVLNGYRGIGACVLEDNAHEQFSIDNFKGTFLYTAAEVYNQADVGTWKNVYVNGSYYESCSLCETPVDKSALKNYLRQNAVGLILGDLEWTEFANLKIDGCKYGIRIVKGHRIEFAGSIYEAVITNCDIALRIESMDNRWGMLIANSTLEGSVYSIQNNSKGVVKGINLKLTGATNGSGTISYEDNQNAANIEIDYTKTYQKPVSKLYQYQGTADGKTDLSAAIQALLDEAGKTGGVVYLPSGLYRLDNPITVPTGVELRGSAGSPTREAKTTVAKGTILLAYYGDGATFTTNDQALITLKQYAGVNGIRILYPDNGPLDSNLSTTFAIRGNASDVYVINTSIAGAAYGVDFSGCDNHYIKKLVTCCYYNAMTVGGDNGTVEGCLQNGTALARMSAALRVLCNHTILEGDNQEKLFKPITQKKLNYIIITEGNGQTVYNTFAYGPKNLILNQAGKHVEAINVGADNIGSALVEQTDGSLSLLCAMRYAGTSVIHTKGTLNLYARLTINNKNELTEELVK